MGKKRANINEKDWRNKPRRYHGPRLNAGNAVALNMDHDEFDLTLGVFGTTVEGRSVKVQPTDRLIVVRARAILLIDGVEHTRMTQARFVHKNEVWGEAGYKTERTLSGSPVIFIKREYLTRERDKWLKQPTTASDVNGSDALAETLTPASKSHTIKTERLNNALSSVFGDIRTNKREVEEAIGQFQARRKSEWRPPNTAQTEGRIFRIAADIMDLSDSLVGVDKISPVNLALQIADLIGGRDLK